MPAAADRPIAVAINRNYFGDEEQIVHSLAQAARLSDAQRERVSARAQTFVEGVRAHQSKRTGLDALLRKYDLSSQEGVIRCVWRRRCCAFRTTRRRTS
jgi:RHH-type proline utilization regulon transcriptional repressor/proline dehydrogenase/delta 1-pyrroline-5-carboxylate dehydrogenase